MKRSDTIIINIIRRNENEKDQENGEESEGNDSKPD